MAKMTFTELNDKLDACIEDGKIFNVDFGDLKYAAERLLGADCTVATHAYLAIPRDDRDASDDVLYWNGGNGPIVQFPSKKFLKVLGATNTAYGDDVRVVVATWTPVAEKFRTLKPLIVKGRKPSATPRTTPVRTLDNTGTCACCGQNVKMSATGDMVAHGYTIQFGYFSGECFGVGYPPVEVSPAGAIAYRAHLLGFMEDNARKLETLVTTRPALTVNHGTDRRPNVRVHNDGDATYERQFATRVYGYESLLRQVNADVIHFTKVVTNWTARPLPDAAMGVAA